MIVVVDIIVANCQIRALKPRIEYQNIPMPTSDAEKAIFWNTVDLEDLMNENM
jgi:hypothetical protein